MYARHQPRPTADVIRIRALATRLIEGHPSALARFVSTVVDVTCDIDLVACARNTVLDRVTGDWIVFVDDAVELQSRWLDGLGRDLAAASAGGGVACSVGSAGTGSLDVAYRRDVIDWLGPFSEPGSGPWTSDLDMQLRLIAAGFEVQPGTRRAA